MRYASISDFCQSYEDKTFTTVFFFKTHNEINKFMCMSIIDIMEVAELDGK